MLPASVLALSLLALTNAYNTPPTFKQGTQTVGMIDGTMTTTSGYAGGTTTCFCGPSQIPDYVSAVNGFLAEYCGGNWEGGSQIQHVSCTLSCICCISMLSVLTAPFFVLLSLARCFFFRQREHRRDCLFFPGWRELLLKPRRYGCPAD